MCKTMTGILAGLLALMWVAQVQPGEGQDARAVIKKAVAAMGGEANLEKHKSATWTEKGTYYGMGEGLPYVGVYAVEWPDKFRMEIQGVFTIVLNADNGWVHSAKETKAMSKDEVAAQQQEHKASWVTTLWPLKDKAFKLKSLGESKIGDQPAAGVEVTHKGFPDVKLFFDKKTGMLVKSEFRAMVPEEKKEMTMENYYSNYRTVDGIKVPHKLIMKRDGKRFVETEIQEMKVGAKLDAKLFAKPQ
jgi:hypothetical protein